MLNNTVELYPYDPDWQLRFKKEKEIITRTLDPSPLPMEHIGSTSIPGMVAKPIIDILLGVDDLTDFSRLIPSLSRAGYEYIPKPELKTRRFFRKGAPGRGICHLHLCEWNGEEWNEKVFFRDYLRLNPEEASEYTALKKQLAKDYKHQRSLYTEMKGPFILSIIKKSREKG
ncbi:GrpB domain, predicted nucleotidyltransferase, UPF0157 family [Halobacillus dabanensis]|uniref:GrpB domain, predicted nucleotidyltransferase, UPF0157 family n=1 Tax=Halobacillus dabanensis TaxID=240302 RepID=A0A1I4ADA7_HALDA|nr:GrpB family protein [Halobacillus dabanensis]SFK53951.1 GrpB domain, predicted nucleotidyltransferase, UPF0157 family [Halobacillus dabanensis]